MARAYAPGAEGGGSPAQPDVVAHGALLGDGTPNAADSEAGGSGSLAQPVVATYGVHMGHGIPWWCGLTGWGDGKCSSAACSNSRCARGGSQPTVAGSEARGTASPAGLVVQAHGSLPGDACP